MNVMDDISVLILTYNEEDNIGRTLSALTGFPEIVIVDSNSTDQTAEIVARFPNARLVARAFDNHAAQWNYGLAQCNRSWILALDADYVVSPELIDEIRHLGPLGDISGYRIGFRYCIHGRPLRGTLYPPVVAFYRRERAYYVQHGHTQRAIIDGRVDEMKARIDHDDRKPLARWIASQQKYARLEMDHILAQPRKNRRRIDRIRLLGWAAPPLVFIYTLFVKGCLLDGRPGWFYTLQRTVAECMMALDLIERRLRERSR